MKFFILNISDWFCFCNRNMPTLCRPIRKKLIVKLRKKQREKIERMLSAGIESVRVVKRAQALRLLAAGRRSPEVADARRFNRESAQHRLAVCGGGLVSGPLRSATTWGAT